MTEEGALFVTNYEAKAEEYPTWWHFGWWGVHIHRTPEDQCDALIKYNRGRP